MILPQTADSFPNFNNLFRIQSHRRFIQNQDIRIADESLCQSHTLPVAFGKIADDAAIYIGQPDHGADLPDMFFLRQFALLQPVDKIQIFLYRHIRIQRRSFRQIADFLSCFRRIGINVEAAQHNGACGRPQAAG